MRVLISGLVTATDVEAAELWGIRPSCFVCNDVTVQPPFECHLPVHCIPIDRKLGILAEEARNYTLALNADAAIFGEPNPHLLRIVRAYNLPVYKVWR